MLDSRTRILNAASELFLEGGMAALSVRAIAKQAGLSTIGIYSHFEGKQGILDALYIEGFERVAAAMSIPGHGLSPKQKVLASVKGYLEVAEQYGAHYRLIFGELDQQYQPSEAARMVAAKAFQQLIDLAASLMPADATLLQKQKRAFEIWAIVHGYVGLQNHAVSQLVQVADWKGMVLNAIERHLSMWK